MQGSGKPPTPRHDPCGLWVPRRIRAGDIILTTTTTTTGIVKINVTKNLYGEPVAAVGLAKQDRQIRAAQWSN